MSFKTLGMLGVGLLAFSTVATRLDAGQIEVGRAQTGMVLTGGVKFPAAISAAAKVGGEYGNEKRKKRFVIRRNGELLVFATRADAQAALEEDEPEEIVAKVAKTAPPTKPTAVKVPEKAPEIVARRIDRPEPPPPLQSLNIGYILEIARLRGQERLANEMLAMQRFRALIALAEQMQDEEDVEMLLLAL